MSKFRWYNILIIIALSALLLFLTFNRHSKSGYFNYHSELWADRAGYYAYLPAAFKYSFNPLLFPDSVDHKTGDGFHLDEENNTIVIQYTYGIALMQLPFYLIADMLADPLSQEPDGFSPVYHWSISFAAVTYLILGLISLFLFLRYYFSRLISLIVIASVLTATNLLYYTIDDPGMSHVYSFSVFSIFLYLYKKCRSQRMNTATVFLTSFICVFIVFLRPTNIIFLLAALLLDIKNYNELKIRARRCPETRIIISIVVSILLLLIPQIIYWHYTYGSYLPYTYGDEGFTRIPKILTLWFAPSTGLFIYTPFIIVILISISYMIIKRIDIQNGIIIGSLFIILSYILSSWFDPGFGCSFGSRPFVEYYAILCLPLGYLYSHMLEKRTIYQIAFWGLVLLLVTYNIKLTYTFDECFYGSGYWDWNEYVRLLTSPTK
jgi:hypothetical protein